MTRRKTATNTKVLNTLVLKKKQQESKDFQGVSKEFLRYCTIEGLSPDIIKFYDKELKGLFRAFFDKYRAT